MRLKMNILVLIHNNSYWRKKIPKSVQKYGRMRTFYMQAILEKFSDVNNQQNDAEFETSLLVQNSQTHPNLDSE